MSLVPQRLAPSARVCELHRGLNAHVVGDIFSLVVVEVTTHFRVMDEFIEVVPKEERCVMSRLKAVQGMWSASSSASQEGWPIQHNRCEACMLSRIAADKGTLCDLRMTLLSRTRTKRKHRAPSLLSFVDACIGQHESWVIDLFYYSGQRAYGLKAARKAAVRARHAARREAEYGYRYREDQVSRRYTAPVYANAYQEASEDQNESVETGYEDAEYDKRVDSILSGYGPTLSPNSARTVLSSTHGIPLVPDPLKVKKVGGPSCGSQESEPEPSTYIPSRENPNWRRVHHSHLPSLPPKSDKRRGPGSDELAEEYRNLLGPVADGYSESEYSRDEDASPVNPVHTHPWAAETTWSLLYR